MYSDKKLAERRDVLSERKYLKPENVPWFIENKGRVSTWGKYRRSYTSMLSGNVIKIYLYMEKRKGRISISPDIITASMKKGISYLIDPKKSKLIAVVPDENGYVPINETKRDFTFPFKIVEDLNIKDGIYNAFYSEEDNAIIVNLNEEL